MKSHPSQPIPPDIRITPQNRKRTQKNIRFLSAILVLLLVSGCSQRHMQIQEAKLSKVEQDVSSQSEKTSQILDSQQKNQKLLSEVLKNFATEAETEARTTGEKESACTALASRMDMFLEHQTQKEETLNKILRKVDEKKLCSLPQVQTPPPPPPVPPNIRETLPSDKIVVGSEEMVLITPPGLFFPARIDTGAETASIHARNVEQFERDGDRWVRFDMINPETREPVPMETRIVRRARILQSNTDESERRPIIQLSVSIGETTQLAQFTLSDRSHLRFPALIGRNILKDVMVVDVSRTYAISTKNKKNLKNIKKP